MKDFLSRAKTLSPSARTYLALVGLLAAVKLLFLLFPARFPRADQNSAFHWTTVAAVSLMGLAGLILSRKTGFPEMWDARVTNRQRFLVPAVVGLVYGVVTVLKDLPNPAPVHLKLPYSIAFYAYGAVFLEIMLRLFAVPLVLWLVSNLTLRGRWQTQAFWFAAVVASLYEPLPHINEELARSTAAAVPAVLIDWATRPLFLATCWPPTCSASTDSSRRSRCDSRSTSCGTSSTAG